MSCDRLTKHELAVTAAGVENKSFFESTIAVQQKIILLSSPSAAFPDRAR
jgi:hypothetical protein